MRRLLLALALVTFAAGASLPQASAATDLERNRAECPSTWWNGPGHIRDLIRCEVAHIGGIPGGATKALAIAWRESRDHPRAYNPTGCAGYGCGGIYQHHLRYWAARARTYAHSFLQKVWNARTNIVVTLRMVRLHGWGPWGG